MRMITHNINNTTFQFLAISTFGFVGVLSQYHYGGGSDDNLGGGGYFSKGSIVGLSRGIEIGHGHYGDGDEGGNGGGSSGGGLEGGHSAGGLNGGSGGHDEGGSSGGQGGGDDNGYGHGHYSIGFGGSDFKTPVDVHHEEVIHLKVINHRSLTKLYLYQPINISGSSRISL